MYLIKNKVFIYTVVVFVLLATFLFFLLGFAKNKKEQEDGYFIYKVEKYIDQKDFKSAEKYIKRNEDKWHGKGEQAAVLCLQKYVINSRNDKSFALQELISCSKESKTSPELRNFISYTISKAYLAEENLSSSEKYATQISKNSVFYTHALENIAIINIKNREFKKAFENLNKITESDNASPNMKRRAEKLKYYVVGYL